MEKHLEIIYIKENDIDENITCDICLQKETVEQNEIILCELCNIGVHQFCYGEPIMNKIPDNSFHY